MKALKIGIVAAVAAVGLAAWFFTSSTSQAAPQVSYTTLSGETITPQDLKGKVTLVKFWATSCVTCIQQMPETIALYNEFKPEGYQVIAVAMDYDPINYVRTYTETRKLPFKVVHDDGTLAKAFGDVKLTPTAFLIDKQGRIVKRYLGNYNKDEFVNTVQKALKG
jgi:peroxiredoxin